MSFAIAGGALAGLCLIWLLVNVARSRAIRALRVERSKVRRALTEFAQAAIVENSIIDILARASEVASQSFGAHRFVFLQEEASGWVASQPVGPPPPPLPESLRGLFGWFIHNPLIVCESDLAEGEFGAMRASLKTFMDTYAIDVIVPLVHQDGLLAVVGMAIDRKPSFLDRECLRIFRLEVTVACTNVRLHHKASHLFSLAAEVAMAQSIELAMVPKEMSGAYGAFQWTGHSRAAGKASSDFLGIYPLEGDRLMVVVGDSVGRDLAGTMVSAVLKSACDQVFASGPSFVDPAQLLNMLNDSLFRPTRPALASCSVALFDARSAFLSYANAGHVAPYLLRPSPTGAEVSILAGTGPLLGDLAHPDFTIRTASLSKQDSYVFLTDGLLAPRNAVGDSYGYQRFQQLLKKQRSGAPDQVCAAILSDIESYSQDSQLWDDQALLVLKYH